jgi:SAM-dependent methyltransferase
MSPDRTREFFHEYANDFNAIYSTRNTVINSVTNHLFRKSMKLRFLKSIEGCKPVEGKRVLDVGCGPGHYSISLARLGAQEVVGIDFAEKMIQLARQQSRALGVEARCKFLVDDFSTFRFDGSFEHVVVMGFMDYVADPTKIVEKVLNLTNISAFFSFPVSGGILAWQRQVRYRRRCDLFLYNRKQLENLFSSRGCAGVNIEQIDRDFFVTVHK